MKPVVTQDIRDAALDLKRRDHLDAFGFHDVVYNGKTINEAQVETARRKSLGKSPIRIGTDEYRDPNKKPQPVSNAAAKPEPEYRRYARRLF